MLEKFINDPQKLQLILNNQKATFDKMEIGYK